MRVEKDFVLREIAGEYIIIPTGELVRDFNGMITLNDVAYTIWQMLQQGADFEQLVKGVLKEFDVDEITAREDIQEFLDQLNRHGILRKE